MAGDGWVLVGDAYSFVDPIYSSGVFLALKSGELAAAAIHEALAKHDPTESDLGAFGPELNRGIDAIRQLVYAFYTPGFSFARFVKQFPQHRLPLVDLLVGLCEPDRGTVRVNGKPLRYWKLSDWRSRVGVVPQDPVVFNMTLRQNIAIGAANPTDEAVERAARLAHAEEFILRQPLGYETVVGEQGAKLSGGQRQRVFVAQGLAQDHDMLLLDEPLTGLDLISAQAIDSVIHHENAHGCTVVMSTHDLAEAFRLADRVAVLVAGRLEQVDTPQRMLAQPESAFIRRLLAAELIGAKPSGSGKRQP